MFVVGAPTRDFVLLAGVEGSPFGAAIDLVFLDDEAAVRTDGLGVFVVRYQSAATLRTVLLLVGNRRGFLRFGFGLSVVRIGSDAGICHSVSGELLGAPGGVTRRNPVAAANIELGRKEYKGFAYFIN